MLVNKAYRFRLYPTKEQEVLIAKTIGCSRFVFNRFLSLWNENYQTTGKGLSYSACSSQLTKLKKELDWLQEVDSHSLQSSLKNLADSFDRFLKKQNKAPRFKSKKNKVQSYTTNIEKKNQFPEVSIAGNRMKLPKLGWVRFANSRDVQGRILNATVRKNPSGKHFVSLLVEIDVQDLPKTDSTVGIDVGLKDFAILSNGKVYKNPKFFRTLEEKLAKAQRVLSRRQRLAIQQKKPLSEAKNVQKQRMKVARVHEQIANARTDYLQKITTEIIKNHDVIGIEDLKVSNMLKNRTLSKAISEVSWSEFRRMLEYKAKWYGKKVIAVDPRYTSQKCHSCGHTAKENRRTQATFICVSCGHSENADLNASRNIHDLAMV
ncbi:IS200/IS605 family element RNA-guided endonuclease TnpB [Domibacillus sp. DTU_2020_1001157_1_SI_ALB_TIR_016]|uniref:IS200/IS605 family element RNA-guided endonuclease TnpB n=1 Tax=Domibacillus sp. DTU_2020_1001157_1_SI_ALB_TIR_016 TaxID=3077789 RepID=UPI0028EF4F13|nr:IS200/IS605 family element RNA-guided endonuclease TnpB [Domibacillus sp. DTU_2020_1001157_1_SI_ALB_TIR_016]WNS78593.1 IS200/IS605 family element RNA-guided endonuclease TnpB [Domibacillus sp. DTU_2020_1001157_1_SI_ALB_TIR_016]